MTQEQIDRINELSRKQRSPEGLTEEEKAEQLSLRQAYLHAIRQNLTAQLNRTYLVDEQGNKTPLKPKQERAAGYDLPAPPPPPDSGQEPE